MKKTLTMRNNLLVFNPAQSLFLATWLEQFAVWVVAIGVDWTKLPWVFAGAAVSTLKSQKDANGQPVHKSFGEWVGIIFGGAVIGLAAWRDVVKLTTFTPEFSAIIAGLIGWILADFILKKAKQQFNDTNNPTLPKL